MFHRRSGIVLAGITVAVIAALAAPAGTWGHASANLHIRQPWTELAPQYQSYVNAVLNCKNS
jgi:hypothetical protein